MDIYSERTIQLLNCGRQDCKDMHSWGPGMRPCYIIHYVLKGSGYLECNRKTCRIEAGESFVIFPYEEVHYFPDAANPWEYIWVDFTGDRVEECLQKMRLVPVNHILPDIEKDKIYPFFQMLQEMEPFHQDKGTANGILMTILGRYADAAMKEDIYIPAQKDNCMATAILLIHANFHRAYFHVDTLCEMLKISRVTLYRLFQKSLQTSPSAYLLEYRLTQAMKMLEMGTSVKNVSISCGFSDSFYFSKMFKKYKGMPPSLYKRNLKDKS